MPSYQILSGPAVLLLLLLLPMACDTAADGEPANPTGSYELVARMGERTFPLRLDLLDVQGGPWGRLTVVADEERVVAVRGISSHGTAWEFAAGGPIASLRLNFADTITGMLSLANGPSVPLEGHRAGEVASPEELRAQHVLEPLGLAARAGQAGASFPTLTPEGEMIFARHGSDLSRQTLMMAVPDGKGGWGDPAVLPFSGDHGDRSPAMLADGTGLVFASDRPVARAKAGRESAAPTEPEEASGQRTYRLWFVPRSASSDWGTPRAVEFDGGWEADARQPSVTADGRLYFSSDAPGGHGEGDIYVADSPGPTGHWGAPRNLDEPINGPGNEHGAFVAQDGRLLLLTSDGGRTGFSGGDDIYVSRSTGDGWSPPLALPLPINTFANEYGAWLSFSDGYLYFSSDRYGHATLLRVETRRLGLDP